VVFGQKEFSTMGMRMGMGRGYPNPSGTGMKFNFPSMLSMGRVTSKYMRVGYRDECHAYT